MAIHEEIFKDIRNYEGLYKISNYGKILSLPKTKPFLDRECMTRERILNNHYDNNGYQIVFLCKNKKRRTIKAHKLVVETFISSKPDGENIVIHHKDGNKRNNYVSNLEWSTSKENSMYAVLSGAMNKYSLTVKELWHNIEVLGVSGRRIAREIGCSHETVNGFIRREKKAGRWHCE